MLSDVLVSVIKLSVIMLSVIMVKIMALKGEMVLEVLGRWETHRQTERLKCRQAGRQAGR
jgi:hypothetical protein